VPELAGAGLEARIAELVEAHRAELEQLVDQELDRAFDTIVVERSPPGTARGAERH
jgi:hypothetical protein